MAPENELVKEDDRKEVISSLCSGSIGAPSSTADAPSHEALRNDVYTAAAYGDLEKLQKLVEAEGCSVTEPDGSGYYALQWAALNNRIAAAQFIIETTHVAAQYGQTAFLYNIVAKWNADPDLPDNDGRSPLHWSVYKGFADCILCLLLFLDAYQGRQDKDGCTPLHWAAIKGNLEVCTVLVQAGKKDDLMAADNTGSTPTQLAVDKNHRQVAFFLDQVFPTLTAAFGLFAWLGVFPCKFRAVYVL
ncbi:hypothetical protein HPP92_003487 [Vanilla planifolia]|uniref:S-acyltransferase n=1 Tax=Vanilla planifolia TaxID=51239 RepID=A0A835SAG8_VANPL|nr:hypothetical protein HPP92_003487 [Vanilla planifolia]